MKKALIIVALICLAYSSASADMNAEETGTTENATTKALIDTAEDGGKSAAGSAIDQAAGSVGGMAGTQAAAMGKDMANKEIGGAADSARAKFGVGEKKMEEATEK